MRVCIHRGTKQIGGTCVEIEASGSRIIVDLGLPLDAVEADPALVPQISGLREHDPSLLAIVLSHGHRDHWGLVPKVRPDIPIVMGRATESIMRAAADFVPDAFAPSAWKHLESGKPLQIGPFAITPHLVDHSGFDAYALEIEAGGRRLFYSGDLRAHGRKGKLFELMLASLVERVIRHSPKVTKRCSNACRGSLRTKSDPVPQSLLLMMWQNLPTAPALPSWGEARQAQ